MVVVFFVKLCVLGGVRNHESGFLSQRIAKIGKNRIVIMGGKSQKVIKTRKIKWRISALFYFLTTFLKLFWKKRLTFF